MASGYHCVYFESARGPAEGCALFAKSDVFKMKYAKPTSTANTPTVVAPVCTEVPCTDPTVTEQPDLDPSKENWESNTKEVTKQASRVSTTSARFSRLSVSSGW